MKRIIISLLLILSFFIVSCNNENKENNEINNITFNDSVIYDQITSNYQVVVSNDTLTFKLQDYIKDNLTKLDLLVKKNDEIINKDNLILLDEGDNLFTITFKNNDYKFNIYRKKLCKLNLLNLDGTIKYAYDFEEDTNINLEMLELNEEFVWDLSFPYIIKEDTNINYLIQTKKLKIVHFDTEELIDVTENESFNFDQIDDVPGYIFKGYYFADGTKYVSGMKYELRYGNTLTANYSPNLYKLKYIYNGNEKEVMIHYKDKIEDFIPSIPGYTFNYWMYKDQEIDLEYYDYLENMVVVANMSANTYKIHYINIDNEFYQEVTYNQEFSLYIPTAPSGKIFIGWYLKSIDGIYNATKYEIPNDIELSPIFKDQIQLEYELYGGELLNSGSYDGDEFILPSATLTDYKFSGWYLDPYFTTKIEKINMAEDEISKVYAHFEYDDDNFITSFGYTRFNSMTNKYDEVSLYEGTQSSITSLYWQKITITKTVDNYYVDKVEASGISLSTMRPFEYLLEAYSSFPRYNDFCNLEVSSGNKVIFITDPTNHSEGSCYGMVSFLESSVENIDEIRAYLANLYDSYVTVEENIDLVSKYENYNISWVSSSPYVIDSKGVLTIPNRDTEVTLSAYVLGKLVYSFSVNVKGKNGTSKYLSTGYIYTNYGNLTQFAMNNLDVIYCSFLNINASGEIVNGSSLLNKINSYVRDKATISGTKIVVSVNQENNSGAFAAVAGDATLRSKVVKNIIDYIVNNNLDGVDIDWETPTAAQATTFTALMKDLYVGLKALNQSYLVTAAIGGGKWAPPKYDLPNSINYLDYINMMTYSMASSSGYFQNALYKSSKSRTLVSCSIDESIKIYNDLTIPNEKILVGIPFYCVLQKECDGAGTKTGTGSSISYSYYLNSFKTLPNMVEYYDEECCVPYAYDATNKYFVSFDNERSIQDKCNYIHNKDLGGLMFWQYGQDVNDYFMNAISKYLN